MAARSPTAFERFIETEKLQPGKVVLQDTVNKIANDQDFLLRKKAHVLTTYLSHHENSSTYVEIARFTIRGADRCDSSLVTDASGTRQDHTWVAEVACFDGVTASGYGMRVVNSLGDLLSFNTVVGESDGILYLTNNNLSLLVDGTEEEITIDARQTGGLDMVVKGITIFANEL